MNEGGASTKDDHCSKRKPIENKDEGWTLCAGRNPYQGLDGGCRFKKKRETSKQERPLEIRFESIEVPSAEEGRKKATSFNSAASHGYGQPA